MAIVRYRPDPSRPPRLAETTKARLLTMTEAEIERNAVEDDDNPPLDGAERGRIALGSAIRRIRRSTDMSQELFAARFRIDLAHLRDWERGRSAPDSATLAYLTVIEKEPEAVDRALVAAE